MIMARIGFLVNPIAGMGGRVGLKGTDGVTDAALKLGARPTAHLRASAALCHLRRLLKATESGLEFRWITCSGAMGAEPLTAAEFADFDVVYHVPAQTTERDTKEAAKKFSELGVDLILFCGGDGTARDLCSVIGDGIPILGIPAGVKMHSGVFGITPHRTAEIVVEFLERKLTLARVDVVDLDEDRYRKGEWVVRLYYSACTPLEPTRTQAAKMMVADGSDAGAKNEIARQLLEEMTAEPDTLFLLGPGSTTLSVGKLLGIDKTLLGIDAVVGDKIVAKDVNERAISELFGRYQHRKLVVSPIGAQGFVLGRGNLQLSADVVRSVGIANIVVIATPAKIACTPLLRFDTGDAELDAELTRSGYVPVVIGYRLRRLVKAAS
jgi:predicted polyphosphate/ATP-dependent NAD kinase